MADISQYLAAIMAAVYGEDVRGSIHDAIEIINEVGEKVLSTGTVVVGPSSSSSGFFVNSLYINTNTMELWKCIGEDSWSSQGVLKGDPGTPGTDGEGIQDIQKTGTSGLVDTYTIYMTDGTTTYNFMVTNGQNGNKWYRGTAISGKSVNPTIFADSGITLAYPNDFYLNPTEGAVYYCETGGAPTVATWVYDFTMTGGGGGGTSDYNDLTNQPQINSHTLSGNSSLADIGLQSKGESQSGTDVSLVTTGEKYNWNHKANEDQTFTQASTRANIASGESFSTILGKIAKWFNDLKDLAFIAKDGSSAKYLRGDGTWQTFPTIPTVNDGTFSVQQNGTTKGSSTANQSGSTSANIITDEWKSGTTTVNNGTFSFSGLDDTQGYAYKPYVYVTGSSVNKNPTAQISAITGEGTSNMTVDYTTDADNGAQVKLRIIK